MAGARDKFAERNVAGIRTLEDALRDAEIGREGCAQIVGDGGVGRGARIGSAARGAGIQIALVGPGQIEFARGGKEEAVEAMAK
jgi:hypothetical protein